METSLLIRRRASKHPRRANHSPRGSRPSCTLTARPCAASQKSATTPLTNHKKNPQPRFNRNQQYSITAVSDGGGAVVERYAYSAHGQATFADGTGSQISNTAISNRYTYTGQEWDESLGLYHYRARMYDAVGGRFVSRDPIRYRGSTYNLFEFVASCPLVFLDAYGKELSLTPNFVGNHPVIKSKIGGTTLGETECDFKVSCSCTRSFKWIGGCILGILWPDGYSCELEYSLKTTITLDYDKHGGTGPYLSGTYGHELIHAMNCRRKARQLYATGKKSGHFDSTFACIENAVEIESDINTWNYQEHLHMNPDSPLPGFPYPIDPDLVDPIWTPENPPCPITLPHPWPGR